MARLNIDTGTLGNPATGDTLRTAMTKINTNFAEVYSLVRDGSSGLIATDVTNGDLKLQANGTGVIEIDTLQVNGDAITSIVTNGSVDITGNGTGGVNIEALSFNGTSISSADSSSINLNENVDIDGDLNVTGNITGAFSVSAIGDITAVGSTLSSPSNADLTIQTSGSGNVVVENLSINGDGAVVTGIKDEDNMASDSAVKLATQQSIKAYVDAEDANIASDSMTFTNKAGNISQWTNDSNYATQAYVDARDIGDLSVVGSTISAPSNADLTLTTSGTGSVSVDGIQIKGTELSSTDSTQVTIKENLHVTGNITGTLTGSVAFSNVTSTPTTSAGYGITDAASSTATAVTVVGDDSSGTAVTLGETFKIAGASGITTAVSGDTLTVTGPDLSSYLTNSTTTIVGDDSSGTTINSGETFKFAGATGVTTAVSGDTLTITGPDLSSYITASSSDTLTNKTIDANGTGNSISNLEVADFAGSAIINVAETLASNDSDTALVTAGAIIDYVDAQDANIASDTLTFTNKTFDVEGTGNSISNIDVADFKAAAIVTAAEGIGSNNNDTTIPTSAAVKAYADSVGGGSTGDLTITGSTISSPSNGDLTLTTSGTGNIVANATFNFNGDALFDTGVQESFSTLTSATGTVTHDCDNGHVFRHTTPSANWTANFTNLSLTSSYATTLTLVIVQGATAYIPTAVQIGGSAQTLNWQGGSQPIGTDNGIDVVSFSILNVGGTYTVLGQLVDFG